MQYISIHAPRVGCDTARPFWRFALADNFNPRTPGGVRLFGRRYWHSRNIFQSTHPGWGATTPHNIPYQTNNISIHAPRVGCDSSKISRALRNVISIHAPRVGCDSLYLHTVSRINYFNPRTPGGVRHGRWYAISCYCTISIHAPRVGCDLLLVIR